ncbi:hypothetical protein BDN70DRAFT_940081 [Pholiota conissans]|uniref:Uncharacterized protein n=1 Tax=Pholiota conissans TaxID=109636 RepID=A0A9P6CKK6_9AGAR|nr:hypothetical protein BDN70DRAFT_940081 [Pholiota conissans]
MTDDAPAWHPPDGRTDALPPIGKLEVTSLRLGGSGNKNGLGEKRRVIVQEVD